MMIHPLTREATMEETMMHNATQQYLIWVTGWATYEIGRLEPIPANKMRGYRAEYVASARMPLGQHDELTLNGQVITDLHDAGLLERTPYWMSGTNYTIWAISDETAMRLRDISAETIRQRKECEERERAEEREMAKQTTPLCPLCHSYCYGDCQANG
jgi:hypothetical protein